MEKIFVVQKVATQLWATENAVDSAMSEASAMMADMLQARKDLGLSAVVADWQLIIAGPLLGYFASGIFSGFGPYLSELFPSDVRGAGQGFCYNVGRGVAGIGPFAIGWLSTIAPIGTAMTVVAIIAYLLAVVAVLFLPETRGKELTAA